MPILGRRTFIEQLWERLTHTSCSGALHASSSQDAHKLDRYASATDRWASAPRPFSSANPTVGQRRMHCAQRSGMRGRFCTAKEYS